MILLLVIIMSLKRDTVIPAQYSNEEKMISKTTKTIILIATLVLSCQSYAQSILATVNNTAQTQNTATVYAYPDFSEGYYATIIEASTCDTHSVYQTCTIAANSKLNLRINQYNAQGSTIVCLSKTAPSGSFHDCAPEACEEQVHFTPTGPVATPLNGNCADFTLNKADPATIMVK